MFWVGLIVGLVIAAIGVIILAIKVGKAWDKTWGL